MITWVMTIGEQLNSIYQLDVKDGDTIIASVPVSTTIEKCEYLREAIIDSFNNLNISLLVVPNDINITTITKIDEEKMNKLGWYRKEDLDEKSN